MKKTIVTAFVLGAILGLFLLPVFARADEAADLGERGKVALARQQYKQALAFFDKAVQLQPKEARYVGLQSIAHFRLGEYDEGIADLKKAIELHPNDIGVKYNAWPDKPLSSEALAHGEEQVRQMLHDRPAMAQYPEEAVFLRRWAARKFAGEDVGSLIDWNPDAPIHSDAEHLAPDPNEHGSILVQGRYTEGPRRGQERSFEELWAGAIYELHNINYAKRFVEFHEMAAEGKINRRDYVAGIVKYEVYASQETRAFYLNEYLPFTKKLKLETDPELWFAHWWDQPDEALSGFTNIGEYPWNPYGRQHDWATVKRLFRRGRYEKAISTLDRMCDESDSYPEHGDHGDVHLWLGQCRMALGQYQKAFDEFNAALRLDPKNAEARKNREKAIRRLQENPPAKENASGSKKEDTQKEKYGTARKKE